MIADLVVAELVALDLDVLPAAVELSAELAHRRAQLALDLDVLAALVAIEAVVADLALDRHGPRPAPGVAAVVRRR